MSKAKSPWQPIETAPTDARRILFYWPSEDSLGPSYAIGQISSGGFYDENGTEDDNEFWTRPLYWMPIPPLPEGER